MHLGFFFTNYVMLVGGIKDGLELLNKACDVKDVKGAGVLKVTDGKIEFSGMDYHYKTAKALFSGFNLSIKPGEKIGLVGRSGAGKSTLVKLLSRYYDVQGGKICIDGQNIAAVTQESCVKISRLFLKIPACLTVRLWKISAMAIPVLRMKRSTRRHAKLIFTTIFCPCRRGIKAKSAKGALCFPAANGADSHCPCDFEKCADFDFG